MTTDHAELLRAKTHLEAALRIARETLVQRKARETVRTFREKDKLRAAITHVDEALERITWLAESAAGEPMEIDDIEEPGE